MDKNKSSKIYTIIFLGVAITTAIVFIIYYWPIVYDRYISKPKPVNVPNTNVVVEEKIYPDSLSRILIPELGIDAVLVLPEEDSKEGINDFVEGNLDYGVVYYPNGVQNLLKENISFFGHSSSIRPNAEYARVFVNLDRLKIDDEIILLDKNEEQIKYKVTIEPTIVEPNENDIVKTDKGEGLITLVTCWPPGTTQKRIYVTGEIYGE